MDRGPAVLTDVDASQPASPSLTMLVPDFPFGYDRWVRHSAGLGRVPRTVHGSEVAVIGGGVAGLVAAYELMKVGLRPVVYEADQLGGRMRSVAFEGYPGVSAELGAMRFGESARTLRCYLDEVGLQTRPFPNPLTAAAVSTVIDVNGESYWARSPADLPDIFRSISDAWDKVLHEYAEFPVMDEAIRRRDVDTIKERWNRLVHTYDDCSFYGFLAATPAFASFRHREIFGQVGFGVGGWDTDFPNSILEILRVVYTGADRDQFSIAGGCQRLPLGIWWRRPDRPAYWPRGTSLESLHPGGHRPAVTRLRRVATGIAVTDAAGTTHSYPAVVLTAPKRMLLSSIDCDRRLLSAAHWTAIERLHYMASSKLFVLTDRPFWLDLDPKTGRELMGMTLTDRMPRSVYLFDNGSGQPGVICLSYTWNDDSHKVATLPTAERLAAVLGALRHVYPDVDIESHIMSSPLAVSWETEPHFMGAFKANLPGHYRYQRRLFTHFMQDRLPCHQRGLVLAGDDVSWTGGFAEGAVTTALNAVWAVIHQLDGHSDHANPGPGDLFEQLAPVELPDE
jgi:lysine 2-monooxygenase